MYKTIYRVTDGFKCVLFEILLCGDTREAICQQGLGTSGLVFVALLLCSEKPVPWT